jgi:hypothetical protein
MRPSYSQIAEYRRCGRRYYFKRIDHNSPKFATPGHIHEGTAYHAGVAIGLREKQAGGQANITAMTDAMVEVLNRPLFEIEWGERKIADAERAGVNLVRLYHERIMPTLTPTHVEEEVAVQFSNRPWAFVVRADCEGMVDPGATIIIDHKRVAKTPAHDIADRSEQLTAYALGAWVRDERIPELVRMDHAIALKSQPRSELGKLGTWIETSAGVCGIVPVVSRRTMEDIDRYLRVMDATWKNIEAGVYNYAPADAWWCSPTACEFWEYCRKN